MCAIRCYSQVTNSICDYNFLTIDLRINPAVLFPYDLVQRHKNDRIRILWLWSFYQGDSICKSIYYLLSTCIFVLYCLITQNSEFVIYTRVCCLCWTWNKWMSAALMWDSCSPMHLSWHRDKMILYSHLNNALCKSEYTDGTLLALVRTLYVYVIVHSKFYLD